MAFFFYQLVKMASSFCFIKISLAKKNHDELSIKGSIKFGSANMFIR
jgi:hypothetical protein